MASYQRILAAGILFANIASSAPIRTEQHPLTNKRHAAEHYPITKHRRDAQLRFEEPLGFPFGGPRTSGSTIFPYGPPPSFLTSFIPGPPSTTAFTPLPTTTGLPPTETSLSPTTPPTTFSTPPTTTPSLAPPSTAPIVSSTTTFSTTTFSTTTLSTTTLSTTTSSTTTSSTTTSSTTTSSTTPPTVPSSPAPVPSSGTLQISLGNTLDSDNVHVYVTGVDSTGRLIMLTTSGEYYYPDASGSTPQAITADVAIAIGRGSTKLTLPDFIWSARVWFADGTLSFSAVLTTNGTGLVVPSSSNPDDPDVNTNWGFMELTYDTVLGLFANLSFVDFVGLSIGLQLLQSSGATQTARGLPVDGVSQLCQKLTEQESKDSQPWSQLCKSSSAGSVLRVLAPSTLISQDESAFATYWNQYIDETWQKYVSEPLTINTQSSAGNIQCTSDGTTITCPNSNKSYSKPSAADVFGCASGPFAIDRDDSDVHKAVVPRLCAAIHRSTLDHRNGNVQPQVPPSEYYRGRITNWYSAFVHQIELDGKGYAFPYDDVSPTTQDNTAGVVAATDPELLTITIG